MTISVVVIMFAFSLVTLITSVEKVFFPSSTAMYFVADLWQREGTSINVQRDMTEKLAERLRKRPDLRFPRPRSRMIGLLPRRLRLLRMPRGRSLLLDAG